MLEEAEKLSSVAMEYKTSHVFNKAKLAPNLTPEILFGLSNEDRSAKYSSLIEAQDAEMKSL